jgi:hypothetical protein
MSPVNRSVAFELAGHQHWRCIWCELRMARTYGRAEQMLRGEVPVGVAVDVATFQRAAEAIVVSFEHFEPRAAGGPDVRSNGFASCRWCNNFRGSEEALVFKARIVALVAAHRHPRQLYRANGIWPRVADFRREFAPPRAAEGAVA